MIILELLEGFSWTSKAYNIQNSIFELQGKMDVIVTMGPEISVILTSVFHCIIIQSKLDIRRSNIRISDAIKILLPPTKIKSSHKSTRYENNA